MVAIQPQPLDTSWIFLVWPGIFGISSLFSIAACFLLLLLSLLRFNDRPLLHGFLPNGMLLSTLLHFLFRTASFLVMSMGRSTLSAYRPITRVILSEYFELLKTHQFRISFL
jgi:hypothetical protein